MGLKSRTSKLVQAIVITAASKLAEPKLRWLVDSPILTKWNFARVLAIGGLLAVSVVMYFDISSAAAPDVSSQDEQLDNLSASSQRGEPAGRTDAQTAYPLKDFWIKVDRQVAVESDDVLKAPQEAPRREPGLNIPSRQAAQQELIDLGFATTAGGEFRASLAETDDAGQGDLLLEAGFTEQQIRNAQERQRSAYEEAGADAWFRLWASMLAQTELRRQGFADFRGNVNIAAAYSAGLEDLLLHAGVSEQQISDARRRQQ